MCTWRAPNISSVSAVGADVLLAAIEHQRANAFGHLGAARFARRMNGDAARAQRSA